MVDATRISCCSCKSFEEDLDGDGGEVKGRLKIIRRNMEGQRRKKGNATLRYLMYGAGGK